MMLGISIYNVSSSLIFNNQKILGIIDKILESRINQERPIFEVKDF